MPCSHHFLAMKSKQMLQYLHRSDQSVQGEHGYEGLGAEAQLLPCRPCWACSQALLADYLSTYCPGLGGKEGRRALSPVNSD